MIHATFYVNNTHAYTGFDFIGHAEYSEAGTDIVCAAASMLVINTLNAIELYTGDETSCVSNEDDGMIEFRFREEPTHDAQLLVKAMLLGLESLEDNDEYEPYIDIIFEEV